MSRPDPENAKPGVRLSDTTFSAVPAQPLSGAEHLAAGLASAAASGFRGGPVSRRNYVLGILNGALGTVAYDFVHPDLILAGLVFTLSRTAYGEGVAFFLVAVLSIINKGGSLLPQLYVSSLLEHRPRKRPFYVLLTFIRGGVRLRWCCQSGCWPLAWTRSRWRCSSSRFSSSLPAWVRATSLRSICSGG